MGVESFKSGAKVCTITKRFPKCRQEFARESNVSKMGLGIHMGLQGRGHGGKSPHNVERSCKCGWESTRTLESSRGNAPKLWVISFFEVVIHYIPCKYLAFSLVLWVSFGLVHHEDGGCCYKHTRDPMFPITPPWGRGCCWIPVRDPYNLFARIWT